ncbi:MAG: biopolymer transporter ExbD [Spirochaetota bacterium]
MRFQRRLVPRASIDMTPLIDVIMMITIFFMITTTFRTAPGISLALPGSSTAQPVPLGEIRIVAVSPDEIYVDGERVDLAGLEAAVAQAAIIHRAGAADAPIRALLEAPSVAEYQLVVSAMDALRRNGIDSVGLATSTAQAGTAASPASAKPGARKP